MSAIEALCGHRWAIQPEMLQTMKEIALRENDSVEAISTKLGRRLDNTRRASIRDGVAIIPVTGPIFKRANMLTECSGATSMEVLARDLTEATDNPNVGSILLDVDSPGGMAFGPSEMADIIIKARRKKPVIAYVGGICASAAYWIASAADEIVMHKSAMAGSIGVVVGAATQESPDRDGYRYMEIVSSNAQYKRVDAAAEEGRAKIVEELDAIEEQFISSVAANRGVSVEYVKTHFGQGGMFIAAKAVAAKMADRLSTFEDILAECANGSLITKKPKGETMNTEQQTEPAAEKETAAPAPQEPNTQTEDKPAPQETAPSAEALKALAAKEERERILAIEDVAMPGHEKLVDAAKRDPSMTAEKLSVQILKAQKETAANFTTSMAAQSAQQTEGIELSSPVVEEEVYLDADEKAAAEWKKSADIRNEFGSFETYKAYVKANDAGRVKVLDK